MHETMALMMISQLCWDWCVTVVVVSVCRGELGLRGSQLEGLTRELEFTRRCALECHNRTTLMLTYVHPNNDRRS
jgi:hypothetical protein